MPKVKFGFQDVEVSEKEPQVQQVFSSVASSYDIMNDLMSLGLHKAWKDTLIAQIPTYEDEILLDIAGGTGDVAARFIKKGGAKAIVADLNPNMLSQGQKKYKDLPIEWVHANAQGLPFKDNTFDYCTISFGLRNTTDIKAVLTEAYRVLKPHGKFLCLEFSQVITPIISKIYDLYSLRVIPKIGRFVAHNEEAYKYLVESIRTFESASRLVNFMQKAGFDDVHYTKLCLGVVAIHIGYK